MKIGTTTSGFVRQTSRLDGNFHLSDGLVIRDIIKKSPYGHQIISEIAPNIHCPGIFPRNYVEQGIPFLGGADIQKADYSCGKYLCKNTTPNHADLTAKKGTTLVTCGGTIGETAFVNAQLAKCWMSQHVMRVEPANIKEGMLYAYLASSYGKLLLTTDVYGSVIPTLNSTNIGNLPIPKFPKSFEEEVDNLIQESAKLRDKATDIIKNAKCVLLQESQLEEFSSEGYDHYGPRSNRKVSCFTVKRSKKDLISIHAFNHSLRIKNTIKYIIETVKTKPIKEVIDGNDFFSTGSFPRVEVQKDYGIMLINQSDVFDAIINGKHISKRNVNTDNLVEYGEVLIAGVGTLGENEKFCHTVFANEDLQDQLVSGEFIRMKTTDEVPSGYLFAWLDTDYGFRLIRSTQAGTKLCRPIPKLLRELPVPIIEKDMMLEIDKMIREAHTMRHQANCKELKAIQMVEEEIEKWGK